MVAGNKLATVLKLIVLMLLSLLIQLDLKLDIRLMIYRLIKIIFKPKKMFVAIIFVNMNF